MDPEQTFLRVHARLSGMLAQLLSPRLRGFLEHLCLVVAILLLALLAVMHVNFVSQAGCASELSHDHVAEAELLQIKMVGQGLWSQKSFRQSLDDIYASGQSASLASSSGVVPTGKAWFYWLLSSPWNSKGRESVEDGASNDRAVAESSLYSAVERQAALLQLWDSWTLYGATWLARVGEFARRFARFWRNAGRDWLFSNAKDGTHAFSQKDHESVEWSEEGSDGFEPVYLYSVERGYLLLPDDAKAHHNVRTLNMSMSARNSCFGNRWQQLLINSLVGYDTILMNSLLEARGEGYLYNFQTKELYGLNHPREAKGASTSFQGYVISKCGVLIMSLFVFFTTTMSVSFTLRETQARMLKFTVQLQYHARHRLPTFRLIFVHVIESLVFVPIMIGILFFLFEFYEDQLLAFMVLTLVWLCELFTMISVRTPVSMQFFPRYFFLYFMVFHIYFFSYEYGFSYLAFSTTAAFMQHLVLYFWNHFEVPALQRFLRTRVLFQQPGFQITSSAIITSTLHVARLAPTGPTRGAEEPSDVRAANFNGFDENARNLAYQRQFNRLGIDEPQVNISSTGIPQGQVPNEFPQGHVFSQGQASGNAFSQVWPPGTVDSRVWLEHWNGVGRNHAPSSEAAEDVYSHNTNGNSANGIATADDNGPPPSSADNVGRPLDTEHADREQQSFELPARNTAFTTAWNSFGSILLWILGGPSEHLSSYLTSFRDLTGDNNATVTQGRITPQRPSEGEGELHGLRHRARNVAEGDGPIS
ncbi:hypothetical protein GOP47_0028593 [Adiantum capillus-veneris]|nr:hypothetical protein GOP47_0028593 [Adiantum capillus-veneris]